MGFKPLAFGLLAGDSPKEALSNALGSTISGKAYLDAQDEKAAEEKAAADKAAAAQQKPTGMKKGGKVSSASSRADGIASRGKTRGRFV